MAEDKLGSIWKLREWVDTNFNGGPLADKLGNMIDNVSYEVNSKLAKMEEKQKDSVELPKDKNGRTIHPGDVVIVEGDRFKIPRLAIYSDGVWMVVCRDQCCETTMVAPENVETAELTSGEEIEFVVEEIMKSPHRWADDSYLVGGEKLSKLCGLVHELNAKESR